MTIIKRALVVDDSRAIQKVGRRILGELGFESECAGDGEEALEILGRQGRPPEVILIDWNMPKLDGLNLVRQLRSDNRFYGCALLMVTSENSENQKQLALECGVDDYLAKPYNQTELVEKLVSLGVCDPA